MAINEGVDCDRDLELELENIAFLESQDNQKSAPRPKKTKNLPVRNKNKTNTNLPPIRHDSTQNVTTNKSNIPDSSATPSSKSPKSPRGVWKTTKHGIEKDYGPAHPQNYRCKVCGKLLPSRGQLNEHHRKNRLPVLCPVCKKSFSSPNIRDRHIYSHNLNKQFTCDMCAEQFTFKSELSTHRMVHRTIKTWICVKKNCRKDSKRKGDLVAHTKSHTGQELTCAVCNKFKTKVEKNLLQYLCSHTQEPKCKCKICGKSFVWSQQVKRHMKKDHS